MISENEQYWLQWQMGRGAKEESDAKAALEQGQNCFTGDETHLLEQVKNNLFIAVVQAFISL